MNNITIKNNIFLINRKLNRKPLWYTKDPTYKYCIDFFKWKKFRKKYLIGFDDISVATRKVKI